MYYYVQQRHASLIQRYDIKDGSGNLAFTIKRKLFSMQRKLLITNAQGVVCGYVQQHLNFLIPAFDIFEGNVFAFCISRIMSLSPSYEINGRPWRIRRGASEIDYECVCDDEIIMSLHKIPSAMGGRARLIIFDTFNYVSCIGIAIAILVSAELLRRD